MADHPASPLVALTRAEIAAAEARHYKVEDEGHCGFCDKPKPTYAPWPCTTTRALAGNAAYLALVERIEQLADTLNRSGHIYGTAGIVDGERRRLAKVVRALLSPPKEPSRG